MARQCARCAKKATALLVMARCAVGAQPGNWFLQRAQEQIPDGFRNAVGAPGTSRFNPHAAVFIPGKPYVGVPTASDSGQEMPRGPPYPGQGHSSGSASSWQPRLEAGSRASSSHQRPLTVEDGPFGTTDPVTGFYMDPTDPELRRLEEKWQAREVARRLAAQQLQGQVEGEQATWSKLPALKDQVKNIDKEKWKAASRNVRNI